MKRLSFPSLLLPPYLGGFLLSRHMMFRSCGIMLQMPSLAPPSSVSLFFAPSEAPTYLPLTGHSFHFHYLPPHAVAKNLPSAH